MQVIADLHIHSKYSRACSRDLVLPKIAEVCAIKGVKVVATGDFTHPEWFRELKEKLAEKEKGLYVLNSKFQIPNSKTNSKSKILNSKLIQEPALVRFICATEISCIYSKGGKVRRLHLVILAPNLETVAKINNKLSQIGNLKADGRPILGIDGKELLKIILDIDEHCMMIPAHIWTPWFALFGSKSGFDSIEECFEELSGNIWAIETGLSSDPAMNWRVKNLDRVSIVSNSDAHSLPNIGREANIFEVEPKKLSYSEVVRIIKEKSPKEFLATIEFYPEEGMYHFDGHRLCNVSMSPEESAKQKYICPKCRRPLTIGVMNRVAELADEARGEDYFDSKRVPFKKLIELDKIIAESVGVKSRASKQVQSIYDNLVKLGTEFEVLLNLSYDELTKAGGRQIAQGIVRAREGKVKINPGFDGQYGEIKLFSEEEKKDYQRKLF